MAGETRIDPEHFVEFLPCLADDILNGLATCMGKGWEKWVRKEPSHKFKPSEYAEVERAINYVVTALQMGLLLAKHQPELGDVSLSVLKSRGVSIGEIDEMWQGIIEEYHSFLEFTGNEHGKSGRISPNHFGDFLPYFAIDWLRETMSKHMDKEWQNGWKKRENPFILNPKEKAKIATVGNYATFAILIGLLVVRKQPELLGVDWSRGAPLDELWDRMLFEYRDFLYYKHFVEPRYL